MQQNELDFNPNTKPQDFERHVVTMFFGDEPPIFRQGYPNHELEELVTAEYCQNLVNEIIRLRNLVDSMVKSGNDTNQPDRPF